MNKANEIWADLEKIFGTGSISTVKVLRDMIHVVFNDTKWGELKMPIPPKYQELPVRSYDAEVALICGGTQTKCRICRKTAEVVIRLPWPGTKPTEREFCKACLADIVDQDESR